MIIRTANGSGKFARYRVPCMWKWRRNLKQTNDSCKTRTYILMVFCFSFEVAEACTTYKLNHWRKQEIENLPAQTALFTTPEQHFMYDSLTMYKQQLKIYRQQTAFLNTVTPNFLTREVSHFTYTSQQHNQASTPQDAIKYTLYSIGQTTSDRTYAPALEVLLIFARLCAHVLPSSSPGLDTDRENTSGQETGAYFPVLRTAARCDASITKLHCPR
jgi:hypothetical protein